MLYFNYKGRFFANMFQLIMRKNKSELPDEIVDNLMKIHGEKTYIDVAHTDNDEMAQELAAELRELFPETEVHVDPLSLSVACHIGPGALAIAASKKLEIGSLL